MEIWARSQEVIRGRSGRRPASRPRDLAAVGITNQRETTVVWDRKTGKPVYNAIVWQDTRTDAICNELAKDGGQDRFRAKVGLPLATYFSGPKVNWMLDNVAGLRGQGRGRRPALRQHRHLVHLEPHRRRQRRRPRHRRDQRQPHHADEPGDPGLGSGDPQDHGHPAGRCCRRSVPSSEVYGKVRRRRWPGIPVAGDLGDQQAALFGQTCFSAGEAKNTYGTGSFMLLNTGTKPVQSKSGLLTTLGYKIGDQPAVYCPRGLDRDHRRAGAVAARQPRHDQAPRLRSKTLAKTVDDNGGVYFVPAFSGLFAPYWKSDARGVIAGLTRYVNKGHIARAVLEATAWQTREVLDAMNADSGVALTALKVDGGMVFNDLLMQFQADVLGVPVIRPKVAETTALGAAYAAGLAVGFWKAGRGPARELAGGPRAGSPRWIATKREKDYKLWKKAVTRTFDWVE